MNEQRLRQLIGLSFILDAFLINVPYFILIATFNYPAILREPTAVILTRFQAGGPSPILTWLAFAWVGLPLLFAIGLLPRVLARADIPYLGIAGMIVQMVGLLRWMFVVPVLPRCMSTPAAPRASVLLSAWYFKRCISMAGSCWASTSATRLCASGWH
jgi:hypothetical protein